MVKHTEPIAGFMQRVSKLFLEEDESDEARLIKVCDDDFIVAIKELN